jgi:hypothetical protein
MNSQDSERTKRTSPRLALALLCAVLTAPVVAQQSPDWCGCRTHPASLGAFDTRVASTWPPGTTAAGSRLTLPLPADGVLVFDSMHLEFSAPFPCCAMEVAIQRNAANTPVTILVKGDIFIGNNAALVVRGNDGAFGSTTAVGVGGLGGQGGFRGGDGAFRLANLASDGGAGLGPSGGLGATVSPLTLGSAGVFVGSADLLPLVGGSGGGGGRSANTLTTCSGGGGGGGGGAILLAANGTIAVDGPGAAINADGGNGGNSNGTCASGGNGGSGGAIRLIATTITGNGRVFARGGRRPDDGALASGGGIRMEAVTNTFGVTFSDPVASRTATPGPIVNPFAANVAVTAVAGQPVPQVPQGVFGGIDVQVSAPGPAAIDFVTNGVPTGTTVQVRVKPRVGAAPISQDVTLVNCDASLHCLASATFDLAAGSYTIEARATFQTPGQ